MKKLSYGLLMLLTCVQLFSCSHEDTDSDKTPSAFCIPDSLMKSVTMDTVKTEKIMSDLKLSGKITFNEDHVVKVYSIVSGHVAEVKVSLGDYVEKGQTLATIRSSDMAGFFSDYKSAQSEMAIAKKNLEVTAEMKKSGVSSEKDYLAAQSEYQKAIAQYNKMSEVLKIYGNAGSANDTIGSGYSIKAPISGFIVEKKINTGMELRADAADNLFTLSDLKEVWVIANVYETDIAKINVGDQALISTLSYPDKNFSGKVERVSNVLDPETKVMSVKIKLDNADYTLKPGMFANVSVLFPGQEKTMAVSSKAIVFDENKNYVVVYRKRCELGMEEVTVVKTFGDKCYLKDDSLKEGDMVIVNENLFVFTALKKQ